jgi:arginase family enzyme
LSAVFSQPAQRKVSVIGAALDLGSGRRGVDMGPSAIRYAGLASRIAELGHEVVDRGNVETAVAEATAVGDEQARFLPEIKATCERIAQLVATGFVHVSLDMDALDPDVAPGVGTPVRGGLSYREAHLAVELVAESGLASSLDLVEVNPVLDRENQTGKLAVELVASALGARIL